MTPGGPSPRLLEPGKMRDLMEGNDTTPSGLQATAKSMVTPAGQGEVTFALPDDPSRATLLAKLREQERD